MHLVFVQFGDYAEAHDRFARGGQPDFYGQRESVEHVTRLARATPVTVLCVSADHPERRDASRTAFEPRGYSSTGAVEPGTWSSFAPCVPCIRRISSSADRSSRC